MPPDLKLCSLGSLVGDWRDQQGTIYNVSLDPDSLSCRVHRSRLDGTKMDTPGLIKAQGGRILFGIHNDYQLLPCLPQESEARPQTVYWNRFGSRKPVSYTWHRLSSQSKSSTTYQETPPLISGGTQTSSGCAGSHPLATHPQAVSGPEDLVNALSDSRKLGLGSLGRGGRPNVFLAKWAQEALEKSDRAVSATKSDQAIAAPLQSDQAPAAPIPEEVKWGPLDQWIATPPGRPPTAAPLAKSDQALAASVPEEAKWDPLDQGIETPPGHPRTAAPRLAAPPAMSDESLAAWNSDKAIWMKTGSLPPPRLPDK